MVPLRRRDPTEMMAAMSNRRTLILGGVALGFVVGAIILLFSRLNGSIVGGASFPHILDGGDSRAASTSKFPNAHWGHEPGRRILNLNLLILILILIS